MTTLDLRQMPGQLKLPATFVASRMGAGSCRLSVAWQPTEPRWSLLFRTASPFVQPLRVGPDWTQNSAQVGEWDCPIPDKTWFPELKKLDPSNHRKAA